MPIEAAADWEVYFDPDVWGEEMTYTAAPAAPAEFVGIYHAPHARRLEVGAAGVSTTAPVVVAPLLRLPVDPAVDHIVAARGTTWRVADFEPDGTGLVRLILERT